MDMDVHCVCYFVCCEFFTAFTINKKYPVWVLPCVDASIWIEVDSSEFKGASFCRSK